MFGTRMRLFRLVGIPINVDASWLIILALLTWTLSNLLTAVLPELTMPANVSLALATALIFFCCLVLHELGHAVVARSFDMPIRGITLFLFGGVAEMGQEPPSAGKECAMAIAGPAVSAALSVIFGVLALLVKVPAIAFSLHYLSQINMVLVFFNLMPAFPLDGGRVLRSIIWGITGNLRRATYVATVSGRLFAWLFIILGLLNLLSGNFVSGIWLGLIGMFLNDAAQRSYSDVLIRQGLKGEPVSRFMTPEPIVVPPTADLRNWVDNYVYRFHRKLFPVASNGHLEGVIGTQVLSRIPQEDWPMHTVGEEMQVNTADLQISPTSDALKALGQMRNTGSSRLLVMDGDRLVGILSLKDLLAFLDLKIQLEGKNAA